VLRHRISASFAAEAEDISSDAIIKKLLETEGRGYRIARKGNPLEARR
jgi:hypothetical protein